MYIALSGKPGSPGMGKLVMPRVYISFSPWLLELHCGEHTHTHKHTHQYKVLVRSPVLLVPTWTMHSSS